jgi:hypothetical protein
LDRAFGGVLLLHRRPWKSERAHQNARIRTRAKDPKIRQPAKDKGAHAAGHEQILNSIAGSQPNFVIDRFNADFSVECEGHLSLRSLLRPLGNRGQRQGAIPVAKNLS